MCRRPAQWPTERRRVDWRSLALDASQRSVTKRHAGLQADLGGIAKGYGVDRVAAALDARGVGHYMVEVGGEVRTRGVNAVGEPWRIGIEEPDAMPQRARWAVPLSGKRHGDLGRLSQLLHPGRPTLFARDRPGDRACRYSIGSAP